MTYRELLKYGIKELDEAGVPNPDVDAWELMEKACSIDRKDYLMAAFDAPLQEQIESYEKLIAIRKTRKPLQQILGNAGFMGLTFEVNEHVLSPRQDTELLVEEALKRLSPGMSVLDLCTGSGCVLVSIMRMCRDLKGMGVDISAEALEVAKRNARKHLIHPRLKQGDLFEPVLGEQFDMIVSNPPYIPTNIIDGLMPEVSVYEPRRALDGGGDGLDFYRRIASEAPEHLFDEGWLLFEIGVDEKISVETLLFEQGFSDIHCYKDYSGNDRVVAGQWKG